MYLGVWIMHMRLNKHSLLTKAVTLILVPLPTIFMIGLSRAYNGAHSYNQLVSGFVQGLLIFYLFFYATYDVLLQKLIQIKKGSVLDILLNWVTLMFTTMLGIYFGVYYTND